MRAEERPEDADVHPEPVTFGDQPTAEETCSQADEPEPVTPAWDLAPQTEATPFASEPPAVEAPQVEAHLEPEAPALGLRVDSVEDWLQSRAQDPAPAIPAASWDLPVASETAANRVPELPEIEPGPAAVSYTPTDEFPAYEEPVHVEAGRDYIAPEGLQLPEADPLVVEKLSTTPAAATVDPDDFSQWFQEHADEGRAPRDTDAATASGAAPPRPSGTSISTASRRAPRVRRSIWAARLMAWKPLSAVMDSSRPIGWSRRSAATSRL